MLLTINYTITLVRHQITGFFVVFLSFFLIKSHTEQIFNLPVIVLLLVYSRVPVPKFYLDVILAITWPFWQILFDIFLCLGVPFIPAVTLTLYLHLLHLELLRFPVTFCS